MKIFNIPGLIKSYNQKKIDKKSEVNQVNNKKDAMEVSSEAQLMSKAFLTAKNAPEIREEKVNQIKNALKQGTYNVSTEDVAEKMIKGSMFDKKA